MVTEERRVFGGGAEGGGKGGEKGGGGGWISSNHPPPLFAAHVVITRPFATTRLAPALSHARTALRRNALNNKGAMLGGGGEMLFSFLL